MKSKQSQMVTHSLSAGLAIALLTGCLAAQAGETPPAPTLSETPNLTQTERVALAMVQANNAEEAGDTDALTLAVRLIDGLGAVPLTDHSGDDPLPDWRTKADPNTTPLRGRPLGPGYRKGTVSAGGADRIEQLFLSGQKASVALSGPGKANLELKVADAKNDSVCSKDSAPAHCDWVPIFTQRYTIEVSNPGDERAHYFLVVE